MVRPSWGKCFQLVSGIALKTGKNVVDARVELSRSALTITPAGDIVVPDTDYTVLIPESAVKDVAGNALEAYSFTFATMKLRPVQTIDELEYSGNTAVALDAREIKKTGPGESLLYISKDPSGWRVETVDGTGVRSPDESISMDASGWPHISYFDTANRQSR